MPSISFTLTTPTTTLAQPLVGEGQPTLTPTTETVVLGAGITAPFQRDGKGDWTNDYGQAVIRSNIEQILGVVAASDYTLGELPWRPEFGSLLHLMRHANNDEVLAQLAQQYVVDALEFWEPRIRLVDTRISQDALAGTLTIDIVYDIVSRRRRTPLVTGIQQSITR